MTMKLKILILALILIASIGFVSADEDIHLSNISVPDNFDAFDEENYRSSVRGLDIFIDDYDYYEGPDANEWDIEDNGFKNISDRNYTVVPGEVKNTFNLNDALNEVKGCIELVEINGHKYSVSFWGKTGNNDDELMKNATETLKEFNKLNNLEPIDISTV